MDELDGRLRICEEVRDEIQHHTPDLLEWLDNSTVDSRLSPRELGSNMSEAVEHYVRIIARGWPRWRAVRSTNSADPWVIAYARALGGTVVSEEHRGGRDVKIPEVCSEIGVRHFNLLDLFRAEGFGRI